MTTPRPLFLFCRLAALELLDGVGALGGAEVEEEAVAGGAPAEEAEPAAGCGCCWLSGASSISAGIERFRLTGCRLVPSLQGELDF